MRHTEWQGQAADPYDLNAYKKQFADEHPLEGYLKDVEAGMPRFAGEAVDTGAASAELKARGYVQDADGTWRKP